MASKKIDNSTPLVSVLIGTYNRSNLVHRCLDSILNQNYENIEIIIVNDTSTDNTIEVLEEYVTKYPNKIQFINNETNKGIAYNSNLAYSVSKGEYLALIGDDDEWHDPEKITKQIKAFEDNKKLGIVSTYWNDVQNGQIVKQHKPIIEKNPLCQILIGNGVYCGSAVLVSRQAWESVNGFDERVQRGTDSDLFRSIIAQGYSTRILDFFSTNVYVDDHPRMTPTGSIQAFKKDVLSNEICLKKFVEEFKKCDQAKSSRKKALFKKYIKLLFMEKDIKNIKKIVELLYI